MTTEALINEKIKPENKLRGVAVFFTKITDRISEWTDIVLSSGAEKLDAESPADTISESAAQRVAVIIGETSEEELAAIMERFNQVIQDDPAVSIRYFYLTNKVGFTMTKDGMYDRLRIVYYPGIAPIDLPDMINRSLYKARLPKFLRTGFNVEIQGEIKEIGDIRYRKISIKAYHRERMERELQVLKIELQMLEQAAIKGADEREAWRACQIRTREKEKELIDTDLLEIEYETTDLYIHNKELYQIVDDVVTKITEDGLVAIKKGIFTGPIDLPSLSNNQIEE